MNMQYLDNTLFRNPDKYRVCKNNLSCAVGVEFWCSGWHLILLMQIEIGIKSQQKLMPNVAAGVNQNVCDIRMLHEATRRRPDMQPQINVQHMQQIEYSNVCNKTQTYLKLVKLFKQIRC